MKRLLSVLLAAIISISTFTALSTTSMAKSSDSTKMSSYKPVISDFTAEYKIKNWENNSLTFYYSAKNYDEIKLVCSRLKGSGDLRTDVLKTHKSYNPSKHFTFKNVESNWINKYRIRLVATNYVKKNGKTYKYTTTKFFNNWADKTAYWVPLDKGKLSLTSGKTSIQIGWNYHTKYAPYQEDDPFSAEQGYKWARQDFEISTDKNFKNVVKKFSINNLRKLKTEDSMWTTKATGLKKNTKYYVRTCSVVSETWLTKKSDGKWKKSEMAVSSGWSPVKTIKTKS